MLHSTPMSKRTTMAAKMNSSPPRSHSMQRYERTPLNEEAMSTQSLDFLESMNTRRSIREFASTEVPEQVIENCIKTAMSAPSGANKQPWTFAVVKNPLTKKKIRIAAEEEERRFYSERAPESWLKDLEPLGTTCDKPFLEKAPLLIVLFAQKTGPKGERHYYVSESAGIAAGFLIAALHIAGLATLTHTPSPMGFLSTILNRPKSEKPFLLLPVGYPAEPCMVPRIQKKALKETLVWLR